MYYLGQRARMHDPLILCFYLQNSTKQMKEACIPEQSTPSYLLSFKQCLKIHLYCL